MDGPIALTQDTAEHKIERVKKLIESYKRWESDCDESSKHLEGVAKASSIQTSVMLNVVVHDLERELKD